MTGFVAYLVCCAFVFTMYALQPGAWLAIPLCLAFPAAVILLPTRERGRDVDG